MNESTEALYEACLKCKMQPFCVLRKTYCRNILESKRHFDELGMKAELPTFEVESPIEGNYACNNAKHGI